MIRCGDPFTVNLYGIDSASSNTPTPLASASGGMEPLAVKHQDKPPLTLSAFGGLLAG